MCYRWEVWESWGAEPWVVQVLKEGCSIPFLSRPRLSSTPVPLPSYSPSSIRGLALSAVVADLQSKAAIEPASSEPGFYSHLFVTPKATGWLAASHRSFSPQPLRPTISISYGDGPVGSPISPSGRLDGFTRPSGCLPPSPCTSGLSEVPPVLYWPLHLPVSGSLLWVILCSAGLYSCHGPDLLHYAPPRLPDPLLSGRLASPWFFLRGDCPGERLLLITLRPSRCISQPLQEFTPSNSNNRLSRDVLSLFTFEGFPHPDQDSEGALSLVSEFTSSSTLEVPLGGHVIPDSPHSGRSPPDAVPPNAFEGRRSSDLGQGADLLGRLLPPGSSVVVRCQSSGRRCSSGSPSSAPPPVHRHVRYRLECRSRVRPLVRLVDSGDVPLFHQSSGTSCHSVCHPRFSPSSSRPVCLAFHRQHLSSCLPPQARGHQVSHTQFRGADHPSSVRDQRCSSAPPVCSGEAQCPRGFPQPRFPSVGVRVDSLPGGVSGTIPPLVGQHRPLRQIHEQPPTGLCLSGGGSPGPDHRHNDPVLGRPSGLCLPSVRLHSECSSQGPPTSESGGDFSGSLLVSATVVSGHPGTSCGYPGPSAAPAGLTPPAPLPSFPSEPPHASHDWVSYCQRTARHLGFSLAVARQLAFCHRSSTRVNYQARWSSYRAWCRRQGHSISRPSIAKIADFLLYLRRSLHLSYSSIASYRSMLSAAFRILLPDISSHPVLHDLLRSFRIVRPLPSSRFPPWDLLRVLSLLRGPPFEPLSSCSLWDLTRKVLFLVALATARRVGEIQAMSSSVSYSREDLFLSYLLEFRTKTESASNPLPRSFAIRSLRDFVGSLPDELLLCPVRAVRIYVSWTSSISPHPRSLFCHSVLRHVLSLRMLSAIFLGVSFSSPCPLLLPLCHLCGLIQYALFQLLLHFRVMLLCLISLLQLRGVLPRFLPS